MFQIEEELKKLPGKPGVYIMHGEKDEIIYVGKAVSLKNRVRQYFQPLQAARGQRAGRQTWVCGRVWCCAGRTGSAAGHCSRHRSWKGSWQQRRTSGSGSIRKLESIRRQPAEYQLHCRRNAQKRFSWMLRRVARLIRIAAGTSESWLFIRTTSAASIATSVPAPMAIPMSARVSAGASLIPSPTIATFPFSPNARITLSFPSGRTPAITLSTTCLFSYCFLRYVHYLR